MDSEIINMSKAVLERIALEHWDELSAVIEACGFQLEPFRPCMVQMDVSTGALMSRIFVYVNDPLGHMLQGRSVFDRRYGGAVNTTSYDDIMLRIRKAALAYIPEWLVGSIIIGALDGILQRSFGVIPDPIRSTEFAKLIQEFDARFNPQNLPVAIGITGNTVHMVYAAPTSCQEGLFQAQAMTDWLIDNHNRIPKGGFLNNVASADATRITELSVVVQRYSTAKGVLEGNAIVQKFNIGDPMVYTSGKWKSFVQDAERLGVKLIRDHGKAVLRMEDPMVDGIVWLSENAEVSDEIRVSAMGVSLENVLASLGTEKVTPTMKQKWFTRVRGEVLHLDLSKAIANFPMSETELSRLSLADPGTIGYQALLQLARFVNRTRRPRYVLLELTISVMTEFSKRWKEGQNPQRDAELRKWVAQKNAQLMNYMAHTKPNL